MSDELDFDPEELAMLRQLFRTEAEDALELVTTRVLASGSSRPSIDALTEMMRVTHTLKGAAGTVGLPAVVELSHGLESAFAAFGRDAVPWTASTADAIVEITDGMRAYLELGPGTSPGDVLAAQLRSQIEQLARASAPAPVDDRRRSDTARLLAIDPVTLEPPRRSDTARLLAIPEPRARLETPAVGVPILLDARGADSGRVLAEARSADSAWITAPRTGGAGADTIPPLPLGQEPAEEEVRQEGSPIAEPKAWLRVEPERIDTLMSSAGELLFDRTRIERRVQLLRTLARDLARTRQTLHDAIGDSGVPSRGALVVTEGELAGQAALLSQTTAALLDEIEALRRTIGELQQGLTRIRMASARALMTHAARTLRALRRATGMRVELRALGEETEFDKAVAEQLVDPITQLLRNAVAHAIEPPEERTARGKPPAGTITIRARQDGNLLVLEVSDDGRGIDTGALRDRLVANGHWTAARAQLANDPEILDALLGTGVSVRGDADELAGRGIGLGLVRQTVAKLGGEVKVSSTPNRGTTFSLRLPLSTALAHAMLFKVGGQVYAVPNVHVVDTVTVEPHAATTPVRMRSTQDDVQLPVLRLEQLLGHGSPGERRPGVVVSFAGKSLVCTVDKLVGPREIIIKPLGPLLAPLTLYAGATISGSGKVQLILDPAQLVRRAYPDVPSAGIGDTGSSPSMVLAGRALVVDDSRAIREAMTSMLGREGWIVDVAEDGARALQMSRQLRYDLVVTDLEMPELGGFDLIARLRRDERFRQTPIVVITSRVNPEHRRRARDLGVRAFVAKPITRRKLLEALATR